MAVHLVTNLRYIHVGTSGWSYPHWARGRFYPQGLKQNEWLQFYATHFRTVEVNTSFYSLPRESLVEGWRERAPADFLFTMKMWRRVTHLKKLKDTAEDLDLFFARIMRLKPTQLGAILIQLPPNLHAGGERLDQFLHDLREHSSGYPWRMAFEFRHPSWYCGEVNDVLNRHGAALVLHDHSAGPIDQPNEVDWVYLRRHGGIDNYQGTYSPEQIEEDARKIGSWLKEGREIFVYYDNDADGFALDNARQLLSTIPKI